MLALAILLMFVSVCYLWSADVFAGDRYSGCKPGPKLIVHYTGLVCPPSEVWCEQVTGHSALIVWKKGKCYFHMPAMMRQGFDHSNTSFMCLPRSQTKNQMYSNSWTPTCKHTSYPNPDYKNTQTHTHTVSCTAHHPHTVFVQLRHNIHSLSYSLDTDTHNTVSCTAQLHHPFTHNTVSPIVQIHHPHNNPQAHSLLYSCRYCTLSPHIHTCLCWYTTCISLRITKSNHR